MLNHITILGRLTRDPELRRTQNGKAVTTITLAVERDIKNAQGERETDFIDCVFWEGSAEFVTHSFQKGRMATVEGRLQSRRYTDKNDNKRMAWEIHASNIYFADSKRDTADSAANGTDASSQSDGFAEVEDDGELPF